MFTIPEQVTQVLSYIYRAGYEGYLVGGCVRDMYLGREPKDWDITTNASPENLVALFEAEELKVVYENTFGTVAVIFEEEDHDSPLRTIEITPYRSEGTYTDHRRPDSVAFSETLEEDLVRRDFTINAFAYYPEKGELTDLFEGKKDLQSGIIRAVGNPSERFAEDALRIMRAIRFACQLGFTIDKETEAALIQHAHLLEHISWERIRDEFTKIIMSDRVFDGMEMLKEYGLTEYIIPELHEGIDVAQNRSHIYGVWEHNIRAGDNAAKQGWPLHVRLAALLHDCGKPRTKRYDKSQKVTTFYGHEVVGAKMVRGFMKRMKYPKELSKVVEKLVRYHMFFSDPEKISLSAVRRMVNNVGPEYIWDLMNVRRSDRIGMGRPKAAPYRLRMYESMIDEALRDPISVKMLKLNGDIMIAEMGFTPGRRMGWILHALLEEVIDDPTRNTREYLEKRARELEAMNDTDLKNLGEAGKDKREEKEEEEIKELRKKHGVKG